MTSTASSDIFKCPKTNLSTTNSACPTTFMTGVQIAFSALQFNIYPSMHSTSTPDITSPSHLLPIPLLLYIRTYNAQAHLTTTTTHNELCIARGHAEIWYAHLVTSSGIQLELLNDKLCHFSMATQSCPVEHSIAITICAVEQGVHFGCQVLNGIDVATCCSQV